jgi:ribonuclease PH
VDLDKLGERTIILDCDVIQADGGTRTAAITGGWVALALAVRQLEGKAMVPPGVLTTEIAAISLGLVGGRLLLDLCYEEDSTASADFNLVITGDGRLVEVQGTAEGEPFERGAFDAVLDLGAESIERLVAIQRQILAGNRGEAL